MKRKKTKVGKLILNGVKPESHELDILLFFTNRGKDIELIVPSLTPNSKNADFIMDGIIWEMKSPEMNDNIVVERALHKALCQSCNVIIDLRRAEGRNQNTVRHLQKCFNTSKKAKRLYIITKNGQLLDFKKKSC